MHLQWQWYESIEFLSVSIARKTVKISSCPYLVSVSFYLSDIYTFMVIYECVPVYLTVTRVWMWIYMIMDIKKCSVMCLFMCLPVMCICLYVQECVCWVVSSGVYVEWECIISICISITADYLELSLYDINKGFFLNGIGEMIHDIKYLGHCRLIRYVINLKAMHFTITKQSIIVFIRRLNSFHK